MMNQKMEEQESWMWFRIFDVLVCEYLPDEDVRNTLRSTDSFF